MTRGQLAMLSALLAAITLAVFWDVTACDFVNFDDVGYITSNDRVLRGLSIENFAWAFTALDLANWHPLTWLSHMLDCTLFRRVDGTQNAGMHHLVNLLWHTANSVILFLLLTSMTRATWRSLLVAALFALHPLHVESVAWVAERKDMLNTFFGLLSIAAYLGWVRRRNWKWLAGSCGLFALSLMCKPMLVTLPFVLLLLDYWPLQRLARMQTAMTQGRRAGTKRPGSKSAAASPSPSLAKIMLVVEKLPYFALALVSCAMTLHAQSRGGAMKNMDHLDLGIRLGNAINSYGQYMSQAVWPARLGVHYPYPASLDMVALFATVALLLVVSFAAVVTAKKWPHVIVGWLWFLGTLVPVMGLVQVGDQARADRYTYVPLIGLFIIVAWMIPAPRPERPRLPQWLIRGIPVGLLLAALAIATHNQVRHWRDSLTLYHHTIEVTGGNPVVQHNLGVAYMERGDSGNAIRHIRQALALRPKYVSATRNLGRVLLSMGRIDEGVAQLQMAETAEPDFAVTVADLGLGYKQQGKLAQAIRQFERALSLDPDMFNARINLGSLHIEQQQFDLALPHLEYAFRQRPNDARANAYLGACLAGLGKPEQARQHLEQAVKAMPTWVDPHINFGNVLMATKQHDQAIAQYRQAATLAVDSRTQLLARNNLARALAESRQYELAIAECQALIDSAPDNPSYYLNLAVLLVTLENDRLRDGSRAVQLASQACALTKRQDAGMLSVLAQTQAAAKMFDDAARTAQEAAGLARLQGNTALADQLDQRVAVYRAGRMN